MTRVLSPKAGAALLRKAFSEKGISLAQTEALDLLAKLQGYNAWSHLQQSKPKNQVLAPTRPPVLPEGGHTLKGTLMAHYGKNGELPVLPRASWLDSEGTTGYWDWVIGGIDAGELYSGPDRFKLRAPVEVTLPDGAKSWWNIEQNLSTRWGELNDYAAEGKPGLALLELDLDLLTRLRQQMWEESTFIVRKDNQFGLLFEVEFASKESEADDADDTREYRPHAEVIVALIDGLAKLARTYPQVQFSVPDASEIINDRPAVWGFFLLDALGENAREVVGQALHNL